VWDSGDPESERHSESSHACVHLIFVRVAICLDPSRLKTRAVSGSARALVSCSVMSSQRSSSAPARVTDAPDGAQDSSPMHAVVQSLSHSNGQGGDSPSLWVQIPPIRARLFLVPHRFRPQARVELWREYLFFAVYWDVQNAPPAMNRPHVYHTTLLRAYMPDGLDAATVLAMHGPRWANALNALLNALLFPQLAADGTLLVWLRQTPFGRHSLTFGVPTEVSFTVEPLAIAAMALVLATDSRVTFGERNAAHISWH
jgi:hypothetical protein